MALHLVHGRHHLGCLEETLCLCDGEVGDANGPHQPPGYQLLHGLGRGMGGGQVSECLPTTVRPCRTSRTSDFRITRLARIYAPYENIPPPPLGSCAGFYHSTLPTQYNSCCLNNCYLQGTLHCVPLLTTHLLREGAVYKCKSASDNTCRLSPFVHNYAHTF